jgi:hypothetical protein
MSENSMSGLTKKNIFALIEANELPDLAPSPTEPFHRPRLDILSVHGCEGAEGAESA